MSKRRSESIAAAAKAPRIISRRKVAGDQASNTKKSIIVRSSDERNQNMGIVSTAGTRISADWSLKEERVDEEDQYHQQTLTRANCSNENVEDNPEPPTEMYDCPLCDSQFADQADVYQHMRGSHPQTASSPYSCQYCKQSFMYQVHYSRHMKMCDTKINDRVHCQWCNVSMSKMHYDSRHRYACKQNINAKLQCLQCGEQFATELDLGQHLSAPCTEYHDEVEYLEEHPSLVIEPVHDTEDEVIEDSKGLSEELLDLTEDWAAEDIHDTITYEEKNCYNNQSVSPPPLVEDTEFVNVSEFNIEYEFDCPLCDAKFKNQVDVYTHMRTSDCMPERGRYSCDECNRTFDNVPSLNAHKRAHNRDRRRRLK